MVGLKCLRFIPLLSLLFGRYHTHPKFLPYPAKHISLRGTSEDEYAVVDITRLAKPGGAARILEHMETSRALFELYEGAVVRGLPTFLLPKW